MFFQKKGGQPQGQPLRWFLCAMAFALVMFWGAFADAQVPAEVSSLTMGGTFSQAGEDLNLGFIGGVPLDFMNGHVAWFLQRDTSGEIVLSETLNAHLQGGITWRGWELNAFSDALRDIDRGLQQVQYGYFVQFPKYLFLGWEGTGGVGNAAQTREAVAASTGLSGAALEAAVITGGTTLNYFTFANMHHPGLDLDFSLKALTALDFSNTDVTGTVSTSYDLGRNFSFDVAYQAVYETGRRKFFGSLLGAITWEQ